MLYACELLEEATAGLKMLACQSLSHMNPSSVILSCRPGGHKRNTPLFFPVITFTTASMFKISRFIHVHVAPLFTA